MHRTSLLVCLSATFTFVAACGGDTSSNDSGTAGGTTGSTESTGSTTQGTSSGAASSGGQPTGKVTTLTLDSFDVQPGTERQVCQLVNLPVDAAINVVQFHSVMKGISHHFNLYKMLTDPLAPVSASEAKVHDCSPGSEQLSGDAAYIFGSAMPERTMNTPDGVAFHLEAGQRMILEQHVVNATANVIQGTTTIDLSSAATEAQIEHWADIAWFGNWGFYIPSGQETSSTARCPVPYDLEVFGLMSHTHALGTHFSIEKFSGDATTHLYDSMDWSHPPYTELAPTLHLAAGEGLEWTCTWKNGTGKLVGPGKASTDEMCIAFAAAYPSTGKSADPIQCNDL